MSDYIKLAEALECVDCDHDIEKIASICLMYLYNKNGIENKFMNKLASDAMNRDKLALRIGVQSVLNAVANWRPKK